MLPKFRVWNRSMAEETAKLVEGKVEVWEE